MKEIVIILLVCIVLAWIFYKPLYPKKGRWYLIGFFNQVNFVLNGSKSIPMIPLLFPIIREIKLELTWTEYVKDGEIYQGGIKYYSNISRGIGTKTEFTRLRHLEEHPISVFAVLKDGYKVVLILDVTLRIFDPVKLIPRKGFLTFVEQEFTDLLAPWVNANKDIDDILSLNIDEIDKIFKIKPLLNRKFRKFGFRIEELALRVGIPEESQKIFDLKNQTKEEGAELERLQAVEQSSIIRRTTFENDAEVERRVQKADLEVVAEYEKSIIKETKDGDERIAGAYNAKFLFLGGQNSGSNEQMKRLGENISSNLITHKRIKKERNDESN